MPRSLPFLPASAVGRVLYELLISHSHTSRWYKAIDLPRLGRESQHSLYSSRTNSGVEVHGSICLWTPSTRKLRTHDGAQVSVCLALSVKFTAVPSEVPLPAPRIYE